VRDDTHSGLPVTDLERFKRDLQVEAAAKNLDITVTATEPNAQGQVDVSWRVRAKPTVGATVVAAGVGAAAGAAAAGPVGAAIGGAAGAALGAALEASAPQKPTHSHPPAAPPSPQTAASPAGGPYIAASPQERLGEVVGSGQCVAYVQAAAAAPHTSKWKRGRLVKNDMSLARGTAIATFDPDGTYGNHTDGRSHAAIYLRQDENGLTVVDQWLGQPVHERHIRFGGSRPVNDGDQFHVIL
jgi:hypothetical protein